MLGRRATPGAGFSRVCPGRCGGGVSSVGSSRLTSPSSRRVVDGARPCTRIPIFASGVGATSGVPRRAAPTSFRAARSASIDSSGRLSPRVNQRCSAAWSPVNRALRGDPVRISPGTAQVTVMPWRIASTRSPSANPTEACFAAT